MEVNRTQELQAEVDLRMHSIVLDALSTIDSGQEVVASFLRAAYGKGYSDALLDKGELVKKFYL